MQLFQANVKRATGEISNQEWLGNYNKILAPTNEHAGIVFADLTHITGVTFDADRIRGLIEHDLPPVARGYLANRLLYLARPGNSDNVQEVAAFYETLLLCAADTDAGPMCLSRYVSVLDESNERRRANEVLDTFIGLFANHPLAAHAATLRLGAIASTSRRDQRLIELVEQYSDSTIGDHLLPDYLAALCRTGSYEQAWMVIRDDERVVDSQNHRDQTDAVVGIVTMAFDKNPRPSNPGRNPGRPDVWSAVSTPLTVCAALIEHMVFSGDLEAAVGLAHALLRKSGGAPINLAISAPLHEPSEVVDIADSDAVRFMTRYRLALAHHRVESPGSGAVVMAKLLRDSPPKGVKPYVLQAMSRYAASSGDHPKALRYVDEAIDIIPVSLKSQ